MQKAKTINCYYCGKQHLKIATIKNAHAYCQNCDSLIYKNKRPNIDLCLSVMISALFLFVLANVSVFIGVNIQGDFYQFMTYSSIVYLIDIGFWYLALFLVLVIFVLPLLEILGFIYVFIMVLNRKKSNFLLKMTIFLHKVKEWNMLDIFFVAILVSVIKLQSFGTIIFDFGFWTLMLVNVLFLINYYFINWSFIWGEISDETENL